MTFWERLKIALDKNNITEAELCRQIGITQASVIGWRDKGSMPRADLAVKTAKLLGTSVEYLIEGTYEYLNIETNTIQRVETEKSFLVPFFDQELSAGKGVQLPDYDSKIGLIPVPESMRVYKENIGVLSVKGDSMTPTLNNGDLVICDSCGYDNGEGIYAIRLNGNGYVKRIQVGKGELIIKSDNSRYEPITEPLNSQNVEIIGKVHYVIHHLE